MFNADPPNPEPPGPITLIQYAEPIPTVVTVYQFIYATSPPPAVAALCVVPSDLKLTYATAVLGELTKLAKSNGVRGAPIIVLGVGVTVGVGVVVAAGVGVGLEPMVGVTVAVTVGVSVAVGVTVIVAVTVGVTVIVGVVVGVTENGVELIDGIGVAVTPTYEASIGTVKFSNTFNKFSFNTSPYSSDIRPSKAISSTASSMDAS